MECLSEVSKKFQIPIYGDLQCSSQIGDVSKFKAFDLISPTEKEARISIGNKDAGIEWIANDLLGKTMSKNLIMKLGADGFIAYENKFGSVIKRQYFPALTTNPVDVSGAGDAFLAALVHDYLQNESIPSAIIYANSVAAKVVRKKGVTKLESWLLDQKDLLAQVSKRDCAEKN